MRRLGPEEFSDLVGNPIVFKTANGTMTATLTLQGETFFSGNRVPDIRLKESALRAFVGKYYSDELDATYEVSLDEGTLKLKIGQQGAVKLNPLARNEFQAGDFGTVVFQLNRGNHVPNLVLFSQPARDIRFRRVN